MTGIGEITAYLDEFARGDPDALNEMMPLVYEKLHAIARREVNREHLALTLSATSLVHEAYLDLVGQKDARWSNRGQFFAIACIVMRRILVDHARTKLRQKRGSGAPHVPIEDVEHTLSDERAQEMLDIDQLLAALGKISARAAQVVECRYFGGLSNQETAEALKVSPVTVKRDWQMARAWLKREIAGNSPDVRR